MKKSELIELLKEIRPEIICRIAALTNLWPGGEVLTALHRNESILKRIDKAIEDEPI